MNDYNSIPSLVKQLRDDTSTLVRDEVALAKTEMKEKACVFGKSIGGIAVGALAGYAALVLFLYAIGALLSSFLREAGLAVWMANFVGLGIVALVVGAISAFLIKAGLAKLQDESLVPKRTVETIKKDKELVTNQFK